jgi:CRISPR/Cas system-associated exonuclease Cas4 (RecB family)
MAMGYSGYKRYDTKYKPGQNTQFKVSRSKIDFFLECPRCFWLDRVMGIKRPDTPPFQINKAVDELLKKEFDVFRQASKPHPIMTEYKIDAVPFAHKDLNKWRENFVGVQSLHKPTNLLIFGAVDDVWIAPNGELIVVDYKATAKKSEVSLDADWQIAYKRQMEVYQWLLRKNGFKVSDTGYFVYANGILDNDGFNNRVEFRTKVIPYTGSDAWIEPVILDIKKTLDMESLPKHSETCEYCTYTGSRLLLTMEYLKKSKK